MTMKRTALTVIAALAFATTSVATASAQNYHHGGFGGWHHGGYDHYRGGYHGGRGDGLLFGLIGAGVGLTVAAATLATAPVRAVVEQPPPPPPVYAAPVAYAPYGYVRYRHPHPVAVYSYPQPVYYAY